MNAVDAFMEMQAFDHHGRYLLPDPETGEIRPWTRTTTLAEVPSHRRALELWQERSIVQGFARNPDLVKAAQEAGDDRQLLASVIDAALEASGANDKRDLGTLLHDLTEAVDRGEPLDRVPAEHLDFVRRYLDLRERHGIEIVPGWIERVVINSNLDVAGTVDRLVTMPGHDLPIVADLKTGPATVKYGQLEVAAQAATYATADYYYDDTLHPMPKVDQRRALVIHLPSDGGEPGLYWADLILGLDIARAARHVYGLRQLAGECLSPFGEAPNPGLFEARVEWLRHRVRSLPPPARIQAGKSWPRDVPRKPDELSSDNEIDAIVEVLGEIEAAHGLPFPDADPRDDAETEPEQATPPSETVEESDDDLDTVDWADRGRALLALLDDEALGRACAEVAGCADRRMDEARFVGLRAVVAAVSDPDGVVVADWSADGPRVVPVEEAENVLARVHGGKKAALDAARAIARTHGLPSLKSLAQAAENPLLAALVTSGTNSNQ